jgi:hypothetical protein
VNGFSWTNLSSMLYVEQPVGTGFFQGVPNIKVQNILTFVLGVWSLLVRRTKLTLQSTIPDFWYSSRKYFSKLKGKKTYLTGESVRNLLFICDCRLTSIQYAGTYIPCKRLLFALGIPEIQATHRYRWLYLFPPGSCGSFFGRNLDGWSWDFFFIDFAFIEEKFL